MKNPLQFEPPADFVDPRTERVFQSKFWPRCNGKKAPSPKASDIHDRRCIEFLAAFYRINILQSKLLLARRFSRKAQAVRLQGKISEAFAALERLEDRYAPIGFFGEPEMRGIYYWNIEFLRPSRPKGLPDAPQFSSHFAVPGLGNMPKRELKGRVRILRYG